MAAQFEAERARCLDTKDQVERWDTAYDRSLAAGLSWDAAWAAYQLARAHLRQTGHRRPAAWALRASCSLAQALDARPLLARLQTVAAQARIRLEDVAATMPAGAPERTVRPLAGLTQREAEVLDHVLLGQTYAEIADALFISEKTVSVHISNLLRKTGTRSRVELAEFARRSGTT